MSFFGVGNPFATPVGQKIEQATDGSLPSENWALNIEICDIINSSTDGPKDAIKAIRKRLTQSAGKNYTVVMYTLTVLETCVKNCGKSFHVLVCNKEFISELETCTPESLPKYLQPSVPYPNLKLGYSNKPTLCERRPAKEQIWAVSIRKFQDNEEMILHRYLPKQ